MQTCIVCGVEQPFDNFYPTNAYKSGYRRKCKRCISETNKDRSHIDAQKRAHINETVRKRLDRNVAFRLHMYAKKRAAKLDLDFNITPEDIYVPLKCPITDVVLVQNRGQFNDDSASIDRIDPTKGYIKGNVQVLSWKVNKAKATLTPEQIHKLSDLLKKQGF